MAFAVMIVVTFFMTPILVDGLGDDRYGIWVFVESIIQYLALLDLGITAAVVKYVAKFNATQDKEEVNRVYSSSIAIFSALGLLVGLTTAIYVLWGGLPRSIDSALAFDARIMIALLGFNLAVGLPLSVYNSIVSAIELYWVKNIVQVVMLILRSLVFLWVLSMGWGIVAIGISITVFSLLQHLTLLAIAHYTIPSLKFSFALITSSHLSPGWQLQHLVIPHGHQLESLISNRCNCHWIFPGPGLGHLFRDCRSTGGVFQIVCKISDPGNDASVQCARFIAKL